MGPRPPPAPIAPNRGSAGRAYVLMPHPMLAHATRMIYPAFQSVTALFCQTQPHCHCHSLLRNHRHCLPPLLPPLSPLHGHHRHHRQSSLRSHRCLSSLRSHHCLSSLRSHRCPSPLCRCHRLSPLRSCHCQSPPLCHRPPLSPLQGHHHRFLPRHFLPHSRAPPSLSCQRVHRLHALTPKLVAMLPHLRLWALPAYHAPS